MVKLQKRFAYKYKDKDHFKYQVTIPSAELEKIGWNSSTELSWSYSNNSLVLKPKPDKQGGEEE